MLDRKLTVPEIKCVSNLIRRYISMTSNENKIDLTGQHMHILCFIEDKQAQGRDVFQHDIETELNVRPSTATAILNVLEKNGYISREPIKKDARMKRLVLTEKADGVKSLAFNMLLDAESHITEGIASEDIDVFFRVIEKMKENLCDKNKSDN